MNELLLYAISDQTSEIKTGNIIPEKWEKNGQLFLYWRNNIWIGYICIHILHKQCMNTLDIYTSYLIDCISDCCCSSRVYVLTLCIDILYLLLLTTFFHHITRCGVMNCLSRFGNLPLMSSQVGMWGACHVTFRTTWDGARHTIALLLTTNRQWLSLIFTKDTAPSKQSKSTCVNNKDIHLNTDSDFRFRFRFYSSHAQYIAVKCSQSAPC